MANSVTIHSDSNPSKGESNRSSSNFSTKELSGDFIRWSCPKDMSFRVMHDKSGTDSEVYRIITDNCTTPLYQMDHIYIANPQYAPAGGFDVTAVGVKAADLERYNVACCNTYLKGQSHRASDDFTGIARIRVLCDPNAHFKLMRNCDNGGKDPTILDNVVNGSSFELQLQGGEKFYLADPYGTERPFTVSLAYTTVQTTAYYYPIDYKPFTDIKNLDHTYVQSGNLFYKCHGECSGGKMLRSGFGDPYASLNIADGTTNGNENDGNAHIIYMLSGVCHQIANRILAPARITVEGVEGYGLSTAFFGTYGFNYHSAATPEPDGSYFSKIHATLLDLQEGKITEEEQVAAEWGIFLASRLGKRYDGGPSKTLLAPVLLARKAKAELDAAFTGGKISSKQFAGKLNELAFDLQKRYARIMASSNYVKLFDIEPGKLFRLIDTDRLEDYYYTPGTEEA